MIISRLQCQILSIFSSPIIFSYKISEFMQIREILIMLFFILQQIAKSVIQKKKNSVDNR